MGRIHHETTNNHVPSPVHRQTHSSDVVAEIVSAEWGKMQKGEAREGNNPKTPKPRVEEMINN